MYGLDLSEMALLANQAHELVLLVIIMSKDYLLAIRGASSWILAASSLLALSAALASAPINRGKNLATVIVVIVLCSLGLISVEFDVSNTIGSFSNSEDVVEEDPFKMDLAPLVAWKATALISAVLSDSLVESDPDKAEEQQRQSSMLQTSVLIERNVSSFAGQWKELNRAYSDYVSYCSEDMRAFERDILTVKRDGKESSKEAIAKEDFRAALHAVGLNGSGAIFLNRALGDPGDAEVPFTYQESGTSGAAASFMSWMQEKIETDVDIAKFYYSSVLKMMGLDLRSTAGIVSEVNAEKEITSKGIGFLVDRARHSSGIPPFGGSNDGYTVYTKPEGGGALTEAQIRSHPNLSIAGYHGQNEYLSETDSQDESPPISLDSFRKSADMQALAMATEAQRAAAQEKREGKVYPDNCYEMYLVARQSIAYYQAHFIEEGGRINFGAYENGLQPGFKASAMVTSLALMGNANAYEEGSVAGNLGTTMLGGGAESKKALDAFNAQFAVPYIIVAIAIAIALTVILLPLMLALTPLIYTSPIFITGIKVLLALYLSLFVLQLTYSLGEYLNQEILMMATLSLQGPTSGAMDIIRLSSTIGWVILAASSFSACTLAYLIVFSDSGLSKAGGIRPPSPVTTTVVAATTVAVGAGAAKRWQKNMADKSENGEVKAERNRNSQANNHRSSQDSRYSSQRRDTPSNMPSSNSSQNSRDTESNEGYNPLRPGSNRESLKARIEKDKAKLAKEIQAELDKGSQTPPKYESWQEYPDMISPVDSDNSDYNTKK